MFLKKYNIEFPDAFILLENNGDDRLKEGTHLLFEYDEGDIQLISLNNKNTRSERWIYNEEEIYSIFIKGIKTIPCTLDRYKKMKVFL